MLDAIFRRADVKEFLQEVILDERFSHKVSQSTPENLPYPKNLPSLMFVMDALIKYVILFDNTDLVDEYIVQLRRFLKKCENVQDLSKGVYRILGKMTASILKIEPEEMENRENKQKILGYIYDHYIRGGYLFHAFPSAYQNQIAENGLDPLGYYFNLENYRKIREVFKKHHSEKVFTKNLDDTTSFSLTDSPSLGYYYATVAPYYFSELVGMSSYAKGKKRYDQEAYFRKDFSACKKNVETLCQDLELSNQEAYVVLNNFIEEWKRLDVTNSSLNLLFVKREKVGHNYLKDYRNILEAAEKEELFYSIEKIMEPRILSEKRYTPLGKEDVIMVSFPSYKELCQNEMDFQEEVLPVSEEEEEIMPEQVNLRMEVANTYGNASIVALVGTLLIALGATITILIAIYKG